MLKSMCRQIVRNRKKAVKGVVSLSLAGTLIAPSAVSAAEDEDIVNLRVMETTDIHANLVNYDYYQDIPTDSYGLVKTAALIEDAREEVANNLLFDNGDLIQGNPLGDYFARIDPIEEGETHPVFKVMNEIGYDAGNIGNHEFNYGLDFLETVLAGADFPYVNANVYIDDGDADESNDENKYDPYVILEKTVVDEDGEEHTLNVGVIGFVPPQIMNWDKDNLTGEVIAKDIVETAEKFVPQMQEEGADLIVAIAHSGIGSVTRDGLEENATYDLTQVEGIDTVLFGHSHGIFPSEEYAGIEGANIEAGTINGIPAVMPGFWGSHLGIVDFELEKTDGEWTIVSGTATTRGIVDSEGNPTVEADEELLEIIEEDHNLTLDYIRGPVGETTAPITSYFAQVLDDPSVQIVNNAQTWYVENYIEGTEYDGLPVLSAAAPFKAGTRDDPSYYTEIEAGTIAIKNVSDLYLYPNTLRAVLVNGEQLREWLEMSAGQFNTIDPDSTEEQELVNMDFRSYNFDVIDGIEYKVDVTEPPRYSPDGELINPDSHRITDITFEGEEVTADQQFVVATNNYRAGGGGNFPGFGSEVEVIVNSPDENRQAIIDYISEKGTINPSADNNWSFVPVEGDPEVVFESSPAAQKYAAGEESIEYLETLDSGFARYNIELGLTGEAGEGEEEPAEETPDETEADKEALVYSIKKGDTLYEIGQMLDVRWQTLQDYNEIANVRKLMPGQEITVPGIYSLSYTVKKGDTLYEIGLTYEVAWQTLQQLNNIEDVHKLMPGQELTVPVTAPLAYTVQQGDTLSEIGAAYGVDWHILADYNDLENPDLILTGQVIEIPIE